MPGTTGAATLTGAGQGAAAGSAFGPWGTVIGAGVGAVGGYLSASGTADAQTEQNAAAAKNAAAQSAQSFYNYLASRGINLQQLVAQYPEFQTEYARVAAAGEKRDFPTWLVAAINNDQSHPIWTAIANPSGTAGAANTTLPAWAVDAQGNPLQPALLQQLLGIANGTNTPATAPVGSIATLANARALLQARPDLAAELQAAGVGDDGRSPEEWLVAHITQTEAASGGGTFTDALRTFLTTPPAAGGGATTTPSGPAGTGNNTTLDPGIATLIPQATNTLGGVFDGTYLNQVLKGLEPVAAARDAEAAAQAAKILEQRGLSTGILDSSLAGLDSVLNARTTGAGGIYDAAAAGASGVYGATLAGAGGVRDASTAAARGVYDANVTKLADLLGVRREAAQQIYDASIAGAGGVRDARTTGAKGIYDAELLRADTYGQASEQALSRMLAQQGAERARRGFTGGSSGSNIVDARLTADYLQRGAGVRADAGVGYQGRLSDAGIGYATDAGKAGVGRATTIGQSNEADAAAKLAAAVQLATQLGLVNTNYAGTVGAAGIGQATTLGNAGVTRATTLASASEQDAINRLQAQVSDATRRLGYLTADADIAKANADLKNAQDALAALTANQNRQIGAVGAPFSLAGMDLGLKGSLNDQQYNTLDAILKRLGGFGTTPASGPALTTSTPGSVLNGSQIAGGALTGAGSVIGNQSSNTELLALIKSLNLGGSSAKPASSPDYLGIESIFAPG